MSDAESEKIYIIPPHRVRYLSEISENNRKYDGWLLNQKNIASQLYAIDLLVNDEKLKSKDELISLQSQLRQDLDGECLRNLEAWPAKAANYRSDEFVYQVRGKDIKVPTHTLSLSNSKNTKSEFAQLQ